MHEQDNNNKNDEILDDYTNKNMNKKEEEEEGKEEEEKEEEEEEEKEGKEEEREGKEDEGDEEEDKKGEKEEIKDEKEGKNDKEEEMKDNNKTEKDISEKIINKNIILEDYFEEDEKESNHEKKDLENKCKEENDKEKNRNNKNYKNNENNEIKTEKDKQSDIQIEIKDYSDLEEEIVNRNIKEKERIKSSRRMFLEDKEAINYQIEKEQKEEKNNEAINIMKKANNIFNLQYKEYLASPYRINSLSFEEALISDNRTYFQIYKYYIINSEIVLNILFNPNYLELTSLKIIFLMFIIGLEGLFNALFYQDKYINNLYDNNGKYNFIYNFPKSFLSVIIVYIIDVFLYHLITSKNKFQEILENSMIKNYQNEFESIIKCLKKKIIIFFIIDFILTGFAWYYCSIFCILYQNTSKYWAISLLISLSIHLVLPFIFCFIPTTLRYCAFKKKSKKIYNFNKMLEIL